jgi:hypothetical protein
MTSEISNLKFPPVGTVAAATVRLAATCHLPTANFF